MRVVCHQAPSEQGDAGVFQVLPNQAQVRFSVGVG
jgi:hypothetical protein